MTRWRPRTPRRCEQRRSAPCSPRPQTRRSGWTRRCAATTPRSPTATGTTPGPDRSWGSARARGPHGEAAELLAGQDLCQDRGGRFMIARRVARTACPLWTPTPATATKHRETLRRLQGPHRGGPRLRLIATAVTPANTADAQPAPELINDLLNTADGGTPPPADTADTAEHADAGRHDTADPAEGGDGGVVEEFAGIAHGLWRQRVRQRRVPGALQRAASTSRTQPAAAPRRAASPRTS